MKCRKIEIYDSQEDCYAEIDVSAVFHVGTISGLDHPKMREIGYHGLNIGIAIPFESEEESNAFFERYWYKTFNAAGEVKVYLLGENGEKVPVISREGNLYDPAFGSACLFGYIVPEIVASDDRPTWKNKESAQFGSRMAQLKGN